MILFKLFTKATVVAISLLLLLSACTSTPSVDNSVEGSDGIDEKDKISTVAVDGKGTTESGKANQTDNTKQQYKRVPALNLYLQQQAIQPIDIPASVVNDYQQAISLMKSKKWQQAQVLFDKVILEQPQLSGSYVNKAIIAQQQKNLDEALVLLEKAIGMNKLNLYAHHLQGQVYRLQGQFDKAEQSYLAALAIWPDFAEAQVSMAILLELYRGRLIDAHGYYTSYLLLNSDDEEVKHWKAGLEIKIKRAGLEIPVAEIVKPKEVNPVLKDKNNGVSNKAKIEQTQLINITQG